MDAETEIPEDQQGSADLTSKDVTLLVTARLKIADMQEQIHHLKRQYDLLEHCYKAETLRADRAARLLKEYAMLPAEQELRKLDRKLGLFFPTIMQYIYSRRGK